MNMLGNTLEEIAFEKAGIIKENIPVVIGERKAETENVFRRIASQKHSPVFFAEESFSAQNCKLLNSIIEISVADKNSIATNYQLDLPGIYQTKNILTVLSSVRQLQEQGWKISEEHLQTALAISKQINGLHGRWEVVHQHPTVVMDVGHNEDGVKQIVAQLNESNYNKLHIIIGMVKDKEVEKVLALLPTNAQYYFTKAHIPRALPENDLKLKAAAFDLTGDTFENVNSAIIAAIHQAEKDDLILVCGSVFLVGEVEVSSTGNGQ
jgi:dihydrofolate synthase/folylpolyglutamate synthase